MLKKLDSYNGLIRSTIVELARIIDSRFGKDILRDSDVVRSNVTLLDHIIPSNPKRLINPLQNLCSRNYCMKIVWVSRRLTISFCFYVQNQLETSAQTHYFGRK